MLTDSLDESGQLQSSFVTETTTTLVAVSDDQYTLQAEVIMNVGGRRFASRPQTITKGYSGEANGQTVKLTRVGQTTLRINDSEVACEIRRVEINGGSSKRTSTVYYSPMVPPYVLKRDTVATDANGKHTNYQSRVEVVSTGSHVEVLSETKPSTYVKTIYHMPRGSVTTLEAHCADVPGGVVSSTSEEFDGNGKLVRRSRIELVDYDRGNGQIKVFRRRWFHHRRWFRKN